jgi:hypothetical protein
MTVAHDLALAAYRDAIRLLEAHQAATPHLERYVALAEIAVRETAPAPASVSLSPQADAAPVAADEPAAPPALPETATRIEAPPAPPSTPPPALAPERHPEVEAPAKAPSEPPPALTEAPRSKAPPRAPACLTEGTGDDEPAAAAPAKADPPPAPPARAVPPTLPPPPTDAPAAIDAGVVERPRATTPPPARETRRPAPPSIAKPPSAGELQDRIVALLTARGPMRNHEIAKALDWAMFEVNHALAMLQRTKRAHKDDRVQPALWSAPVARRGAA